MASRWYGNHLLKVGIRIVLVTNDADNKRKATSENIAACTGLLVLLILLCY